MKMQKKENKDLFQNFMLNLSNNGVDINKYVEEIQENGFDLKSVSMTSRTDNTDKLVVSFSLKLAVTVIFSV